VACSAFMNELSSATSMTLMAMPPVVLGDMRGAIVDVAIAEIASHGDEALLINTHLGGWEEMAEGSLVNGRLLALPTPETLRDVLGRLSLAQVTQ